MTATYYYGIYETPWNTSDDDYIIRYAIQNGMNESRYPKFQVALRTPFDTSGPNIAEIDRSTGAVRRFRVAPGECPVGGKAE